MFEFLFTPAVPDSKQDVAPDPTAPPAALTVPLTDVLDLSKPVVPRSFKPASDFAHLTDPDELALSLICHLDLIDLKCPDIKALIASTEGSYQGGNLAGRLAPRIGAGKHRERRPKPRPKPKQPRLANIFRTED